MPALQQEDRAMSSFQFHKFILITDLAIVIQLNSDCQRKDLPTQNIGLQWRPASKLRPILKFTLSEYCYLEKANIVLAKYWHRGKGGMPRWVYSCAKCFFLSHRDKNTEFGMGSFLCKIFFSIHEDNPGVEPARKMWLPPDSQNIYEGIWMFHA